MASPEQVAKIMTLWDQLPPDEQRLMVEVAERMFVGNFFGESHDKKMAAVDAMVRAFDEAKRRDPVAVEVGADA